MRAKTTEAVAIVGLGYVGLSLASIVLDAGYAVVGIDVSETKVSKLLAGSSPVSDLSDHQIGQMLKNGFSPTTEFADIAGCSTVVLALPTPVSVENEPDLGALESAISAGAPFAVAGQLWILESTVQPGATEGIVLSLISKFAPEGAVGIKLAYSPERVDPGSSHTHVFAAPKIVAGVDHGSLRSASAFYERLGFDVVAAKALREAEAAKLLENTYRAVNLALVNEMAHVFGQAGIDIVEVIRLAATKPFGFQAFWPGPGVGGHCIPVDPWYLVAFLGQTGLSSTLTNLALEINSRVPRRTAARILELAGTAGDMAGGRPEVKLLGMTYKADVNDFRGSPGIEIARELSSLGAVVRYHDPFLMTEIPELAASWLSDEEAFSHFGGTTVVLQNHSVYRTAITASAGIGTLYSAAPGGSHLGTPIWIPSQPSVAQVEA